MEKFEIKIWYVRREKIFTEEGDCEITYDISPVETYVSDNLTEVLFYLSQRNIKYENVNKFETGTFCEDSFVQLASSDFFFNIFSMYTMFYANIYHYGELLKIDKIDKKNGNLDYTACGYRYKNHGRQRKRIKKHNWRNVGHRCNESKSLAHVHATIAEADLLDYDIPKSCLNKWKKKNEGVIDNWYLYELGRMKPVRSWKSCKKKRQWE